MTQTKKDRKEIEEIDRNLPPLPDRVVLRRVMPDDWRYGDVYGYTPKQMRMYGRRVWQAARAQQAEAEPVAKVVIPETGGNVGIAWRAVPLPDAPSMRGGELLHQAPPTPAPVVPEGYVLVPKEPSAEHVDSIATRYDHSFGLQPECIKENLRGIARQMYEECTGQGFYSIPASPQSGHQEANRER